MSKFSSEFKKFIMRGNVVDMAVGVIVGGAFTAIVNGLSNYILKPITNWLLALVLGKDALSEVFTFLKKVEVETVNETTGLTETTVDLAQSIYIDWGAFINTIINFFLIAFVLFVIVRFINHVRENNREHAAKLAKKRPTREQRKDLKAKGIKLSNKAAVADYLDKEAKKAERAKKAAEAEAKAKAEAERRANPTSEDLLKEIIVLLKKD